MNIYWGTKTKVVLVYKSQQDAHVPEFIFVWELLYMFRVLLSHIFRSTHNTLTSVPTFPR